MANSENLSFSTSPIFNIFSQKFHRLFLGLIGIGINAKGINVAQLIWGGQAVQCKFKKGLKMHFFHFSPFLSLRRTTR
jgi:hypothetical protein